MTATAPAVVGGWRWQRLLGAPHRLAFFAGGGVTAMAAAWWAVALVAGSLGRGPAWAVPPAVAHAAVMAFGFMPLFIAGFLFTAGPRWLQVAGPDAPALRAPVLAAVAGWAIFLPGAHVHPLVAAAGLALATGAWARLLARFLALVRHSTVQDRLHVRLIAAACVVTALAMAACALGVATQAWTLARAAVVVALWAGLAPVFVAVSHRMVPFFTAAAVPAWDERRPTWLLWTMATMLAARGVLAAVEVAAPPLPPGVAALCASAEVAAAALLLGLAWRWSRVQNLKARLLAMLHRGFVWLGVAMALSAASHAMQAAGEGAGLGLAPLHALTMGFLGSTMLATVTRVSAGHSGRAVAADDLTWRLFAALQAATLLRLAGSVAGPAASALVAAAALAWAASMGPWALRCVRWVGTPRADGRPG